VTQKRVVLATGNAGKLREFQSLARELALDLELVAQADYFTGEADETGLSFVENALIKARHACEHTHLPAIADDSGLIVDALDGDPGVHSARYAGPNAGDQANIDLLLGELAALGLARSPARYHCTLVFLRHAEDPDPLIAQARWEGEVRREASGTQGFGYDPVFWLPESACTVAQLSPDSKNRQGHRGRALQALLTLLREQQGSGAA
jgi:XTP/dITP diphosphohydrolase